MKRILLINALVCFSIAITFAQTTATDFTADDCNAVTHNLFDSLDAGNVIVICWVMPCNPCATYAEYASDAVQSFSTSHPGRVKYYLADDYANSTCSYLSGWASNYNIATDAFFSTTDLDMLDLTNSSYTAFDAATKGAGSGFVTLTPLAFKAPISELSLSE